MTFMGHSFVQSAMPTSDLDPRCSGWWSSRPWGGGGSSSTHR